MAMAMAMDAGAPSSSRARDAVLAMDDPQMDVSGRGSANINPDSQNPEDLRKRNKRTERQLKEAESKRKRDEEKRSRVAETAAKEADDKKRKTEKIEQMRRQREEETKRLQAKRDKEAAEEKAKRDVEEKYRRARKKFWFKVSHIECDFERPVENAFIEIAVGGCHIERTTA